SAQIREILISESAWEEMTCLFAPSLSNNTIPVGFGINETLSASKNNFAWGAGIGAKYAVTDNIMIDASYKYINAGKVSISKNHYAGDEHTAYDADTKAASNDFMLGITYAF
ncbi:outer membrane beta-barrel protein, partial [Salmonella sp. NW145]|uniref:outer membrane protein n=1 Tax=Salmonella sp. NW145 TaxID=2947740 RepID=UPI003F48B469